MFVSNKAPVWILHIFLKQSVYIHARLIIVDKHKCIKDN